MTRARLFERYLLREVTQSWLAVTVVLLAIMLATRFARFLGDAASGQLPKELLFQVAGLSSMQYLIVLTPISLLLAVMMALGRLYRDQEITALLACGVPLTTLYRPVMLLAAGICVLTAVMSFELGPWAGRTADRLVADAARNNRYNPFEAGRFTDVGAVNATLYTGQVSSDGSEIRNFFAVQRLADGRVAVVVSDGGGSAADPATGARIVTLESGHRYEGRQGESAFDVIGFDSITVRIPPPAFAELSNKRKLAPSAELRQSEALPDRAEWAFRIAVPISVLILALLAVPLSHVRPRSGRYGRMVIGVVLYLGYSQTITLAQVWIANGTLPPMLGIWWVHAIFAALALALIAKQAGWRT